MNLRVAMLAILAGAWGALAAIAAPGDAPWPFPAVATLSAESLAGGWRFAPDPQDRGMEEGWFEPSFGRDEWRQAAVPGVWGQAPGAIPARTSEGVGWYARSLRLPEGVDGDPEVVFLGVMYSADVWLGGEYLGQHHGGFTPFTFAVGAVLAPGEEKALVVRVDNRLSTQTIPGQKLGWNVFGGLTREVYLVVRPRLRIEGLRTMSTVGAGGAVTLTVSGSLANHGSAAHAGEILATLSAGDAVVAQDVVPVALATGAAVPFEMVFSLAGARLWSPDDPFLHDLQLAWPGGASPPLRLPVGLRELRVAGPHLLLNGQRLWLQGFGQHEDLRDHGPCLPPGWQAREAERMKAFGANHLRISHYPHHPAFFAACDRLGLLVFTEIPAWQLDRDWIRTEQAWADWAEPQLAEMVRWYGNFTSVVSWGAANEMGNAPEYNRRAMDFLRQADPGRLPMIVVDADYHPQVYDLLPLAGRNLHYGWYHSPRVYEGLRKGLASNLRHAERVDIPIWVAELGGQAHPGRFTGGYNDESRGSETYLDKVVRFGFQYAAAADRVAGIAIWTWSDFSTRGGGICPHGIFGHGREPKMVAYSVRNLFAGDLRVFLCEEDADLPPGGTVRVQPFLFNPRLRPLPPGLRLRWRILRGVETMAAGEVPVPEGDTRALRTAEIAWPIPPEIRGMLSLWVELADQGGGMIHANGVQVGVGQPPERPGALFLSVTEQGKPVAATLEFGGVRLPVYEDPGLIIPLPAGEYALVVRRGAVTRSVTAQVTSGEAATVAVELSP